MPRSSLSFSPNAEFIASVNGTLRIFSRKGERIEIFGRPRVVRDCYFNRVVWHLDPNRLMCICGAGLGNIVLFKDIERLHEVSVERIHTPSSPQTLSSMDCSSAHLAVSYLPRSKYESCVEIWSASTMERVGAVKNVRGHGVRDLSFLPTNPSVFLAAEGPEIITYDIRAQLDTPQIMMDAHASTILALCIAREHTLMTTDGDIVKFWDIRTGRKAYHTVHRTALMAMLCSEEYLAGLEERRIKSWKLSGSSSERATPYIRTTKEITGDELVCGAFVPGDPDKMILQGRSSDLTFYKLNSIPSLSTKINEYVLSSNEGLYSGTGPHDVIDLMVSRAKRGYSLDLRRNSEICSEDSANFSQQSPEYPTAIDAAAEVSQELSNTWLWLARYEELTDGNFPQLSEYLASSTNATEKLLRMMEWPDNIEGHIDELVEAEQFGRAAAIAFFSGNTQMSIDVLTKAASREIGADFDIANLAIAVSPGGDREVGTTAQSVLGRVKDPYIRAIVSMALGEPMSYILNLDIDVQDKIYLIVTKCEGSEVSTYLEELHAVLKHKISGLQVVGLTVYALPLIERYESHTGDLQTCALLQLKSKHLRAMEESWIITYEAFLMRCRLFAELAVVRITRRGPGKNRSAALQLKCKKCERDVFSDPEQLQTRCPWCSTPLPACSVCKRVIGSHFFAGNGQDSVDHGDGDSFQRWYVACISCKHGGHLCHIESWFEENDECPVPGCRCNCFSN